MANKFKVGDTVVCADLPGWDNSRDDGRGHGWLLGYKFEVHRLSWGEIIYWGGDGRGGVYEDSLLLVNKNKWAGDVIVKKVVCLALIGISLSGCGMPEPSWGLDIPDKKIAEAIYRAEGAENTRYPYGIMGYGKLSKDKAYKICMNTIRNSRKRWVNAGKPEDFIIFLGNRYVPTEGKNLSALERELNPNWVRNVKFFINKK